MKRYKYVWLTIFILLALFKGCINSTQFHWQRYCKSIEESKQKKLFLQEYDVVKLEFDENKSDSILCSTITLNSFTIWREHGWGRPPFLIFFHPIQLTGGEVLIIKHKPPLDESIIFFRNEDQGFKANAGFAMIWPLPEKKDSLIFSFKYRKNHINKEYCRGVIYLKEKD